jgi:uncharacterized membrane protein YfcA
VERLVVFAVVGVVAQLVDGTLGMAYGVTSSTLLVATGVAPAGASAAIHLAEIGTTLASGVSHWRFGNVDWRVVRYIAVPGAVGGFLGALALSSLDGAQARPWVAAVLAVLGVYVLSRFLRPGPRRGPVEAPLRGWLLRPLGLFAGFVDAVGGGGWGPVGTPVLLASGRMAPRKVIGSVSTSEFLVAVGASAGFLVALPSSEVPFATVGALLVGGLVAAPAAAWLVRTLPPQRLGVFVGLAILLTNARTLALAFGLEGPVRAALALTIVAVVAGLAVARREETATTAPVS